MHLVAPVLAAALAPLADPTAAAGLVPPDVRWGLVAATVRLTGGLDGPTRGASGVVVGYKDGAAYVLTAAHAVPREDARVFEFFTRRSYPAAANRVIGGEVLLRLPDPDVALVRVKTDPVASLPLAGPWQRPRRFPFPAVSVGCPGGAPPRCRAEEVVAKAFVRRPRVGSDPPPAGAFFWRAAVAPVGGMSGGPLVGPDGRVVGLWTAARDGQGYLTHLDEILAGLKAAGFGWLVPPR